MSTEVAGPEVPPHEPPATEPTPVAAVEVSPPHWTVRFGGIWSMPLVPRMAKLAVPRAGTDCEGWLFEQSVRPVVASV